MRRGCGLLVVAALGLCVLGCDDSGDPGHDVGAEDGQEAVAEGGTCVGTPAPCASFFDYDSCLQQDGCGWVFAYYDCRNSMPTGPTACDVLSGRQDVCLGQVGCRWE